MWEQIGMLKLLKTNHITWSKSSNKILLTGELNGTLFLFMKKHFSGTFLHYGLGLNLIGLDWMDGLDLFTVLLIFGFNTFLLCSVF